MSLQRKLLAAFCTMAVPLAVIGGLTLWNLHEQGHALARLQASLARARLFGRVESATYRKIRRIRDYVGGQDPAARVDFGRLDAAARARIREWSATTVDPDEWPFVRSFEALDREISALAERAFQLADQGRRQQALELVQHELNGRLLPTLDGVITTIYVNARTRNIQRALDEVESTARSTTLVLVAVVLASVVFSGLFSFMTARALARPVQELKAVMDRVAEGGFDQVRALDVSAGDEIGDLARSFVRMTERLHHTQQDLHHKIDTLGRTQAQLVQSEKLASLGQMAAAVAHGLRNPLASIRAATQLALLRLPAESPLGEQLRAVIGEVDRLEKRIAHLLDFARPSALVPAATSVRDLLDSVVAVYRETMAQQAVRVAVHVEASLPAVWVDASQLEQALIELLANALEAMPDGGHLRLAAQASAPQTVRIIVEDTGLGISAGTLERVAEPFFTTKADGTGLGLAIAKRFVEQNHGGFAITSTEHEGTRVAVTLPAVPPADELAG